MNTNKVITANFVSTVPDLIVDNTNATFTGSWTVTDGSGVGASGKFGPTFAYATTVASATATATFRPNIPLTGNYDVYVWFPRFNAAGQRCHDAEYSVFWNGTNETIRVDQSSNSDFGQWLLIETARKFGQGTNGFVRLSNQSTDTGKFVSADAVRWVWSTNQVTQPYFTGVARVGNAVSLTWLSGPNQVYQLQYRTNLASGSWQTLAPNITATNSLATGSDNTLGNDQQRFYRVALLP